MLVVAIAGGVLGFWVFFLWRVRVERGDVGISDLQRIELRIRAWLVRTTIAYREFAETIAKGLTAAFQETAKSMSKWSEIAERIQREEIRGMVATIRSGGVLSCDIDDEDAVRLNCTVVRYVNGLGPGDAPEEYAAIVRAMDEETPCLA